jgi:tryptophanyl-tRNA synthetase
MSRILTGIQPTGNITLGNYLGVIQELTKLQKDPNNELIIFVADLHAITLKIDGPALRKNIKSLLSIYLASGIDPNKCTLFVQSQVDYHFKLAKILESFVSVGELSRMTQFKDKKSKLDFIPSSLLNYPTLMASDILLYSPDYVPVGIDQAQHLELANTIATRFNSQLGDTFNIIKPLINKDVAKIYSLQDPTKKMSKSDENINGSIFLLDEPIQAKNKIKRAVTDSDTKVYFDQTNKPGISNLLRIFASLSGISIADSQKKFENSNYADFKEEVGNLVSNFISDFRTKYNSFQNNDELNKVMELGQQKAILLARSKYQKVAKKVGLL